MKRIILLLILSVPLLVWAGNIQPPSPRIDKSVREYLKTIADNFNNLEIVTTSPNGARTGDYGDMVLLVTGGNYYVEVCVSSPSGTVWKGIVLSATP